MDRLTIRQTGVERAPTLEQGETVQDRAALVSARAPDLAWLPSGSRRECRMPDNLQLLLARRPTGRASDADFEARRAPVPAPGPGEALIQILALSLDPSSRVWMNAQDSYLPAVPLGEVMRGVAVGRVTESQRTDLAVGSLVTGLFGWQQWVTVGPNSPTRFSVLPNLPVSPSTFLGILGGTGLTAYFGMTEIARPSPGETVVVSAAAGAVGSVAGQLAKAAGARVVGICGGAAKGRFVVEELGFDAAVDHRAPDWRDRLAAATPEGIDVDFENVGGPIFDAVLARLKLHARVALCGLIAGYNDDRPASGPAHFANLLIKRATLQGFIILDYAARFPEGLAALAKQLLAGQLKHRETVVEGLEAAPTALNLLFDGGNLGKLVVHLAD